MTELQTELLNILEPYTDKTLSEDCYINCEHVDFWHSQEGVIKKYTPSMKKHNDSEDWFYYNKILWHYDITALLKCIYSISWSDVSQLNVFLIFSDNSKNYYLPNKPLHLYTDEETKEVILLINKLKNV